jgi:hypothetical protein
MLADLDLLLIAVFCTAEDLLPCRAGNARRRITDAEVVTLCVAQAIMGIASDQRFLAVAAKRLGHLFPQRPKRPGYWKRRQRLAEVIEALIGEFARMSPGFDHDLLVVDSTPVECARSRETVQRSQLADAADYGYCRSHSRYFWGFRLHGLFALDGTPRAVALTSPKRDERDVCLELIDRLPRSGPLIVIGDKGYASREFAAQMLDRHALIVRPRRKNEPGPGPHLAPIRQRIESIFWTFQGPLDPRTPRRPHPARPQSPHQPTPARPRRRHRPQPPPRPPQPRTRQLQRLTAWNNSSSVVMR